MASVLVGVALLACGKESGTTTPFVRDTLQDSKAAATADSLVALDPARELAAAVAQGDLRPIGVCGYACMTVGIETPDHSLLPTDSMIIVSGTGDAISGPGMARLNAVADTYATKYNQLLIEHLKAHSATRTPKQGQ